VITLSATALWVLALVARPYTWWRIALVAAMAAGMVLALAVPVSRTFFELSKLSLASDLIALGIAACAGIVLTVFLALTHQLPGGKAPAGDKDLPGEPAGQARGQPGAP